MRTVKFWTFLSWTSVKCPGFRSVVSRTLHCFLLKASLFLKACLGSEKNGIIGYLREHMVIVKKKKRMKRSKSEPCLIVSLLYPESFC